MAAGACLTNKTGLTEFDGLDSVDILARLIFSEAEGESLTGKRGVYHVVVNRKAKNSTEFGGNTISGIALKSGAFDGMTTNRARCPDTDSTAWKDSLSIATNGGTNPIGKCLWFNGNDTYAAKSKTENKVEKYSFNGKDYTEVVEKVVIGGHTFFRLSGY
ncbi:cell wall hydrolase [Paenibacillus sp. FSL W8-0186]|uniref:cell wall hydrolase n=1 Tax=Paenibacillus sp. FSL W8-0186 TaxID=2921709 RepID=UPI0030D37F31